MNKKDTYRSYAIWMLLLLFYGVFYYLNNYAWIDEISLTSGEVISTSLIAPDSGHTPKRDTNIEDGTGAKNNAVPALSTSSTKISPDLPAPASKPSSYRARKGRKININTASAEEWQTLYGIGPYRSDRIVRFRNALGGFYSVDQVSETYGLPDSVFKEIKVQLLPDSSWQLININTIVYDSLYIHPYITKQMAYFIVKHRETTGPVTSMEDLYGIIREKDHERLRKLEPYLDFGIK